MHIAVLGTGMVGQTIAAKLVALGHTVTIGTRDVDAALARTEGDIWGNPSFSEWAKANTAVTVATLNDAAAAGEMIVNALSGQNAIAGLTLAGAGNLAGKVLIDISNPLDFSQGMPPSLFVSSTDSLGERIQREFPDARVVKTLNTITAALMVDPGALAGGDHTMYLCGNDADAKANVLALLKDQFGWRDVIDLGDITNARGTEAVLPVWIRLMGSLETANFGFKVVR